MNFSIILIKILTIYFLKFKIINKNEILKIPNLLKQIIIKVFDKNKYIYLFKITF